MLAGLNPAQGLIFMLQALGGKLISKDMAMRELPFTVNVTQELEKIEIEEMRQSLLNSIQSYTQSIPQMASQGQDASDVVRKIAAVIKARQKGQMLEDAIEASFAPQQQVPPAGAPSSTAEQPSPVPGGAPVGGAPSPMAAQPPMNPMSLIAGLTGAGNATSRATTKSKL
jgi:DNA-binding FrmR family transcriptional regulator